MTRLTWGLIGGGRGSQIGPAHRLGARLDGLFDFAAAALDADPDAGRAYAAELGVPSDRAYGTWQEMLEAEQARPDPVDLVTVATPNHTHYEIAHAFVSACINVLCEKPMTMTVEEGESLVRAAREQGVLVGVNYGYSGYPLVRQMRDMVASGALGAVRLVKAEFAHGHHADAADADNPRVRWRYDPAQAGVSAVMADCGIHALHMACFVTGQQPERLSADFLSTIPSRALEDDALINVRLSGGATCRLWTSAIALGRQHGLTLQVFGETGGLSWAQEQPNQLFWTPVGGRTEIIERGSGGLSDAATAGSRVTVGHAEGMPLAFANLYADLAADIRVLRAGGTPVSLCPDAEDGLRSVAAVHAAAQSASQGGAWTDARPPLLR